MTDVEVRIALPAEKEIFRNLMQLYVHDFSEQWRATPRGELQDDGRFPEYPLDPYWREPDHTPLLFRVAGRIAGFALLNVASHSGLPLDRNMAEFFVARKHRRDGVGTIAARVLFSRYPGRWEAAVARRNIGALAFWRGAASGHPRVRDVEELDVDTAEWNGPIVRFRILPAGDG
jgi:predicted acetyltransferase